MMSLQSSIVFALGKRALCLWRTNKWKTSGEKTSSRDRQFASERRRIEWEEPVEIVQRRAQQAVRFEEEAMRQVVETESKAEANLDQQRFALIDQANYDFNLREARSESTKFDDSASPPRF